MTPIQAVRLSGRAVWICLERYGIPETAENGSITAGLSREARTEKTRLMLQTLLADRFHLTMRRETKELPVYVLVVGKDGPKLQKSAVEEKDCPDAPDHSDVTCHGFNGGQGKKAPRNAVKLHN